MKKILIVLSLLLSSCAYGHGYGGGYSYPYIQDIRRHYDYATITFIPIGRPFYASPSDIVMTYDKWVYIHEEARIHNYSPSIPKQTNIIIINVPPNTTRYIYR